VLRNLVISQTRPAIFYYKSAKTGLWKLMKDSSSCTLISIMNFNFVRFSRELNQSLSRESLEREAIKRAKLIWLLGGQESLTKAWVQKLRHTQTATQF
jgi:hypothetical protein